MREEELNMIDVEAGAKSIVQHLKGHDFRNAGADPTDFQYGSDPGLRFKVGTVRGEVTVSVWRHSRQIKQPIRCMSDAQVIEAKHEIDALVHDFFDSRRVR